MRLKMKLNSLLIIAACFVFGLLFTACGSDKQATSFSVEEPVVPMVGDENERTVGYTFPESIELRFKQVEMTALVNSKVGEGWVQTKTIPFGSINGDPVVLYVYKVPEDDSCGSDYERVVLLSHKNEKYRFPDCFSSSVEDETPEQQQTLFRLDYKQGEHGEQSIVHGAVELVANGPGRMAYYYYDALQGKWFGFEDWGYPRVTDLDGDGVNELINQFPGLHMSWPDITIYQWGEQGLSVSASIKSVIGVPNLSYSSATLDEQTNEIEVTAVMSLEPEVYEAASYSLARGKLQRQPK